jgi:ferritin-like metal-binding protein YciE
MMHATVHLNDTHTHLRELLSVFQVDDQVQIMKCCSVVAANIDHEGRSVGSV